MTEKEIVEKEKEIEEIEIGIKIGFVLNGVNVMGKPLKVGRNKIYQV